MELFSIKIRRTFQLVSTVLSLQALEFYRTADTLVYRVFSHTLVY